MSLNSMQTDDESNVIKILVATDCHLGYEENNPIICDDSFIAFEEILSKAVENEVDMILLGGDLFHHNNPSQRTLNKCMSLLRRYTMGNKPVYLELLSDASLIQPPGSAPVNYLDPNINVSIPVFSIHGNHDDPSGAGQHSSMDTLSSAGLLNYFGKWTDLTRVKIQPILLKKGTTLLALYGLSHIKDDRLCRLFLEEKVQLIRPKEAPNDWFNLFVLHQNRVDRGPKRFISDSYLPNFLDFIIWGHEHDCDIHPNKNLNKGFYISQPGSSVPTSLSQGETKPKHCGILRICGKSFRLTALKLETTRPFVWDCIKLMDIPVSTQAREAKSEEIRLACLARVEEMIIEARDLLTGHPKQPTLPLIRLRCDYDDETQLFNIIKFGQMFHQRVANPDNEVIRIKKLATSRDRRHVLNAREDVGNLQALAEEAPEAFTSCVEAIVEDYFKSKKENRLLVLSVKGMATAVEQFVLKDVTSSIDSIVKHQEEETIKKMMNLEVTEENVREQLEKIRDEREANVEAQELELLKLFEAHFEGSKGEDEADEMLDSGDELMASVPMSFEPKSQSNYAIFDNAKSTRKHQVDYDCDDSSKQLNASTQRKKSGQSTLFGRSRATKKVATDDEDEPKKKVAMRGRGRGRGSRGGTSTTSTSRARTSKVAAPLNIVTSTQRSTPTRQAALTSQYMIASSIAYDDSDSQ